MSQEPQPPRSGNITIFETEDGRTRVEVRFDHENVWLTQKLMADLYECSPDNISLHLKNIFADKELDPATTTEDSSVVQNVAEKEYEVFRVEQDRRYESDFDRILKQLPKPKPPPKA